METPDAGRLGVGDQFVGAQQKPEVVIKFTGYQGTNKVNNEIKEALQVPTSTVSVVRIVFIV